ncbi:hypothetical protein [Thermoactinospora rubra]|uniref:hypothetical protein n=1 Tax=Thermoactinospora rubra TaxID=1088767 RepID=UPI000A121F51|nr:hypothetical protein [Thermoactinospora rubra]
MISTSARAALAATALAATAIVGGSALAAPATASAQSAAFAGTSGSCSKSGAYINFTAHYHNSSRHHVFTWFEWTIGGNGVRNKNNVEVRVKHDNRLGHDPIYWTWVSPDNIRKGRSTLTQDQRNGAPVPRGGVKVPKNQRAYTEFKAVFDKRGDDPRCTGHTRNV